MLTFGGKGMVGSLYISLNRTGPEFILVQNPKEYCQNNQTPFKLRVSQNLFFFVMNIFFIYYIKKGEEGGGGDGTIFFLILQAIGIFPSHSHESHTIKSQQSRAKKKSQSARCSTNCSNLPNIFLFLPRPEKLRRLQNSSQARTKK